MTQLQSDSVDGIDDLYSLAELASFIASRIQPYGEPLRTTIDKARKRVEYGREQGNLSPPSDGRYDLLQVMPWIRGKWPGKFNDVQAHHSTNSESVGEVSDSASSLFVPGDLPRCQAELRKAFDDIDQLGMALQSANAEVQHLKPSAAKYENTRAKHLLAAQRPPKGL